ncbi:hypothetical protein [Promicromonospora sp. NPDC023805]|uniref:hypothetical protein n=1 Tax=Promicromonospora sp. NPDC023805 TaxID=3154696 RepID=UPI0033C69942
MISARSSRNLARTVTTVVATLLLAASFTAAIAVFAAYDGRHERTVERTPVEASEGQKAVLQYQHVLRAVGGGQASFVYIEPIDGRTSPPPGLAAWPDPGEVVISPSLETYRDQIDGVYGTVAGSVGASGLSTPTERIVYVRPADGIPEAQSTGRGWISATGFGGANRSLMAGDVWTDKPPTQILTLIGIFVLVPALGLVIVAVQLGEDRRRRRQTVLEALGATPRYLVGLEVRAAARPALIGVVCALGVFGISCLTDVFLPGVGYWLLAADMRAVAWQGGLACLVAGAVVVAVAAVACAPARARQMTRPRGREPRYPGYIAAVVAVAFGLSGFQAINSTATGSPDAQAWFALSTLVGIGLMPLVCGWFVRTCGQLVASIGAARSLPSLVVTGRHLDAAPRTSARIAGTGAVVVFLVSQVVATVSVGSDDLRAANAAYARWDGTYATVSLPSVPAEQHVVDQIVSGTAASTVVLHRGQRWIERDGTFEMETTLTSPTAALRTIGLEPGMWTPQALDDLPQNLAAGADSVEVVAGDPEILNDTETEQDLVVVNPGGGLSTSELQAALNTIVAPGWQVSGPGETWRAGAASESHQMRWVAWFGVIGAAMLLVAGVMRNWHAVAQVARKTSRITAVSGRFALHARCAAVRGGIVAVTAVLVGGSGAVYLSGVVDASGVDGTSVREIIGLLCLLVIVATAASALHEWRTGLRAATQWRPGKEDDS